MIRKEFSLNGVPFMLSGYNCHVMLEAGGIIDIMTDDEGEASRIKAAVISSVQSHILPYSGKKMLDEIPDMTINIEQEVTEEIAHTTGADIILKFDYILPDESSQKLLDDMDKMKKFSDPAYAAAELERAMKQAQETAMKNGMTQQDIRNLQNAPLPDLPPLPDTNDPLERAKAISAQFDQMKQMAVSGSLAAPAAPAAPAGVVPALKDLPPQPRPKFCCNCGSRLPESGNFCPNCGTKI
jgi:hypothetical protein